MGWWDTEHYALHMLCSLCRLSGSSDFPSSFKCTKPLLVPGTRTQVLTEDLDLVPWCSSGVAKSRGQSLTTIFWMFQQHVFK